MTEKVPDGDSLTILTRLGADIQTPQVLHLIEEIAQQQARALLREAARTRNDMPGTAVDTPPGDSDPR